MKTKAKISVLGAGAWGTALALVLADNGHEVLLWGKDAKQIELMQKERANTQYLKGFALPASLQLTSDFAQALNFSKDILIVVPSHAFRETIENIHKSNTQDLRLFFATKGLDHSGALLHTVIEEYFPDCPFAVLGGPSFAVEVAAKKPTAMTVGGKNENFTKLIAEWFSNDYMRLYTTEDYIGVQLGGAVKNILAVATGAADGLHFGANARAALMTRGLSEMMRLGQALQAKPETFMGLAGLGDLILTCTDDKSRNRRFGLALGSGVSMQEALQTIGQVVEGINTTEIVYQLAQKLKIEMPITEQVYAILKSKRSIQDAVKLLFSRSLKSE